MCNQHNPARIDKCMKNIISFINANTNYKTISSCCGHGRYNPSIVVLNLETAEWCNVPYEIFSDKYFKHGTKKFYKKDKKGYYYLKGD